MNIIKNLFTWALLMAATHVMAVNITVDAVEITAGGSAEIVVNLSNTETTLTGYQMTLFLPEGVTPQTDDEGDYEYTLSSRHKKDHTMTIRNTDDGGYLLVCFSTGKKVIDGTEGELFRLPINVASTVSGTVQGSFQEILFSDTSAQLHEASDVTFNLTVDSSPIYGSVILDAAVETVDGNQSIVVNLSNTETTLTGYQMKLYLPEGVTLQTDTDGDYEYTLSSRHKKDHTMTIRNTDDGGFLLVCFSTGKKVIDGTEGELFRLPLNVASTVSGTVQGSLQDILFSDTSAQPYDAADVTFNLTSEVTPPVLTEQTLSLSALPALTVGDSPYALPQSTDQGLALTWTVQDATVASISNNQLTALKAGTTTVTATQAGNDSYQPFNVSFTLTVVEPAQPTVEVTDISQLDNAVYVEPIVEKSGTTIDMDIKLKNNVDVAGYSFDIALPEGVTLAKNSKGKVIVTLSEDRHDEHTCTINDRGDNLYSVVVLSLSGGELYENDGTVLTVSLVIDEEMEEGIYPIEIRTPRYSLPNGQMIEVASTTSSLTIENVMIGDVNDNGVIDIGDAVCIINHIVGKENAVFVERAADVNGNGIIAEIGDAVSVVNIIVGKTVVQSIGKKENDLLDPQ